MRIALVSMDQQWLSKDKNFGRCESLTHIAATHTCDLIVFPEMTLTSYCLDVEAIAESVHSSPTLKRFEYLARDTETSIIFGAVLMESANRKPENVLCLARKSGEAVPVYSKLHGFSFVGEDKVLSSGNRLGMISIGDLRLGCSICYDLRFPDMFSALALNCNAVVTIANWPAARVAHWRSLLVARAIENQLFVLGVNRIGTDGNGLQYESSSMIVSPDGKVLQPVFSFGELDIYDIDLEDVLQYRSSFPTVRDKRYDLYREFYEQR
ncbi:MAG: hypothetical protein CVU66_02785 [Deltaproteobacteria bacterium HGW-Deltaproteobacteria-23]|nr:MAG: hypothetical protein CVU66_02785 [Deltaproteobacteria bacterium HGW-Deltaproteobacteria-23]